MTSNDSIPTFTLFGETAHFPDVVHCEHFSARAPIHAWRISAHRHAHMAQIFLMKDGRIEAYVDGQSVVVENGMFLFVPANTVHRFIFRPDSEGLVISVPVSVLKTIGPVPQDIQSALAAPVINHSGQELGALADMLARTLEGTRPYRAQQAVGIAHAMLAGIADLAGLVASSEIGRSRERLAALDRLIATHQSDGWGASDYATALSISAGHLSRLCRAATGKGAAAYIEQSLMEEACRMLAFTQLPVSDIGYRLGYADPSYFSKRFRAVRACAPSDYRRQFVD